jgi:hypothetical protein
VREQFKLKVDGDQPIPGTGTAVTDGGTNDPVLIKTVVDGFSPEYNSDLTTYTRYSCWDEDNKVLQTFIRAAITDRAFLEGNMEGTPPTVMRTYFDYGASVPGPGGCAGYTEPPAYSAFSDWSDYLLSRFNDAFPEAPVVAPTDAPSSG